MLGFILSKMNLLILVSAIFAIIGFFMISLKDISMVQEASGLTSTLREKTFALASSPSTCFSDGYIVPEELSIAGSKFYYVLKISKRQINSDGPINVLIFSVYPRDEFTRLQRDASYSPKAIAADSFRTKGDLFLFSREYNIRDYGGVNYSEDGVEEIFIDPQAVTRYNAIEFVKEVEGGKSKLYIIGCNAGLCEAEKTAVANVVHGSSSQEGVFNC